MCTQLVLKKINEFTNIIIPKNTDVYNTYNID